MKIQGNINFEFNCRERSSSFKACADGEYCSSCSTVVLDFTQMSIPQVQEVIRSRGGEVCGKMDENQMYATKQKFSKPGFAIAGIAACVALTATSVSASPRVKVPTEQLQIDLKHSADSEILSQSELEPSVAGNTLPPDEVKPVKKKTFLRIGRRRFYTMNKFPFIGTSRVFYGKYKF